MCPAEFVTWREYHGLVAEAVGAPAGAGGRFVGVPFEDLAAVDPWRFRSSSYFNNCFRCSPNKFIVFVRVREKSMFLT